VNYFCFLYGLVESNSPYWDFGLLFIHSCGFAELLLGMYKNQLQELAQRNCFNLPLYGCIRKGPDHAPRFRATVNFNGEIFESPNYCSTLRQAELVAAEVAVNTLSKRGPSGSLVAKDLDDTGVYKNLLQEIAHRAGLSLPVYTTTRSGPAHLPVFKCIVDVFGMRFNGKPAATKKQAEQNTAMAAWSALKQSEKDVDSGNRIRSFPSVDGNYSLHVYIPVKISSIAEKQLAPFIKKAGMLVPELFAIDTGLPLCSAHLKSNDGAKVDARARAKKYHISLSRTVEIRHHQIDSIVSMLRHKLHSQKRYWIEFGKWDVFINDDQTRSFLAMEVRSGGLSEISKQIRLVNEVFILHNLPEYYKNPRPHISVAKGLGDITSTLKLVADELNRLKGNVRPTEKSIWSYMFSGIGCKIGQRTYSICKVAA